MRPLTNTLATRKSDIQTHEILGLEESQIIVKISKRARRIGLRLDTTKRAFVLTIPQRTSLKKAHAFALANKEWMYDKLDSLPEPHPFEHNTKISLYGQDVSIKIEKSPLYKRMSVSLHNGILNANAPETYPSEKINNGIRKFIQRYTRTLLDDLSKEKAARIKKTIQSVSVRDTKSRWGSCSEDRNLCYSWRLIFAPPIALDYVVAHEVAHLRHMDHSKAFWGLCRELSENYVEGKYWMRNHGNTLMRYGQMP